MGDNKPLVGIDGQTPLVQQSRDKYQLIRAIAAAITSVATASIPIVVVLIANTYSAAIKQAERDTQFIQLAIGILSDEPTENNRPLRTWAVRVIDQQSDPVLKFTDEEKSLLIEELRLLPSRVIPGIRGPTGDHVEFEEW